jgi:hypothetical protein
MHAETGTTRPMNESAVTLKTGAFCLGWLSGGRSSATRHVLPRERDGRAHSELSLNCRRQGDFDCRASPRTIQSKDIPGGRVAGFRSASPSSRLVRRLSRPCEPHFYRAGRFLSPGATYSSSQPELRNGQVNLLKEWRPGRFKSCPPCNVYLKFVTSLPSSLPHFTCLWGHCCAVREDSGSNGQVSCKCRGHIQSITRPHHSVAALRDWEPRPTPSQRGRTSGEG